jgi:hypothetical protein
VIKQLIPAEDWAAVERRLREQARQVQGGGSKPPVKKLYWVPGVFVVIAFVRFLAAIAGNAGSSSNSTSHEDFRSAPPPVTQTYWDKQKELQDKLRRLEQDMKRDPKAPRATWSKEAEDAVQRAKKTAEEEARRPKPTPIRKSSTNTVTTFSTPIGQPVPNVTNFSPPTGTPVPNLSLSPVGQPAPSPALPPSTRGSETMQQIMGGPNPSRVTITLPNGQQVQVANPQAAGR